MYSIVAPLANLSEQAYIMTLRLNFSVFTPQYLQHFLRAIKFETISTSKAVLAHWSAMEPSFFNLSGNGTLPLMEAIGAQTYETLLRKMFYQLVCSQN
jgi:hypothetical protein